MGKKILFLLLVSFCGKAQEFVGQIERNDPELDKIIKGNPIPEIITKGYKWTEGPVWSNGMLLFSDVPNNVIYKWTDKGGAEVYLKPSGFTGKSSESREPGSNGLLVNSSGQLMLCQHGDRQIAIMDSPFLEPKAVFKPLAQNFGGKRFNSPNDLDISKDGEVYFTDPPYGLPKQDDTDPSKELAFNGVFKIKTDGKVVLLVDSLTRPNGIALFPDQKRLLVANSDFRRPHWYVYDVKGDLLENGRIFYSALNDSGKRLPGLPDGLKIDKLGNVYASGPGGIFIFNSMGKLLGKIVLPEPASNCALSDDEKTLFITNNKQVLRLKMRD